MGAEPWSYFVPYRDDIEAALQELRQEEFRAGRYRWFDEDGPPPATIDELVAECDADGTASILDMLGIVEKDHRPNSESPHYGQVAPLGREQLLALFGTDRPTRAMIEADSGYFEWIERGEGIYIEVYEDGEPSELFFAGYSFD